MKKQITVLILITLFLGNVFAGKPVNKEPSPLSVLESQQERESWCETEGYALVGNYGNLHYWLYSSYIYHDGDISSIIFDIVPKWFQSMGYFVVEDYKTVSPNNDLAESVKQLMDEQVCDVSITFIKGNNSYDNVIVNSFDPETELYTTYIFSGTKVDRAITSSEEKITSDTPKAAWYDAPELKEWREYLSKNISDWSILGELTELQELVIGNNSKISNLHFLDTLNKLKSFRFVSVKITTKDLSPLDSIPEVAYFHTGIDKELDLYLNEKQRELRSKIQNRVKELGEKYK